MLFVAGDRKALDALLRHALSLNPNFCKAGALKLLFDRPDFSASSSSSGSASVVEREAARLAGLLQSYRSQIAAAVDSERKQAQESRQSTWTIHWNHSESSSASASNASSISNRFTWSGLADLLFDLYRKSQSPSSFKSLWTHSTLRTSTMLTGASALTTPVGYMLLCAHSALFAVV